MNIVLMMIDSLEYMNLLSTIERIDYTELEDKSLRIID